MTGTQPTTTTKRNHYIRVLVALALLASMLVTSAAIPAHAASTTFTVNSTADTGDATPDGTCDSCTLREAIQEANATTDADTINFNIPEAQRSPNTGVATISPQTDLPAITNQVTINGYTQPAVSPNTKAVGDDASLKILLDGNNVPTSGLEIASSSRSVIKGLVIYRFNLGINIHGDSVANRIEGNFIGLDPSGTLGVGNFLHGVNIQEGPTNTVVGGSTPAKRNVISFSRNGSAVALFDANGNRVMGNYIGTDKNGTAGLLGNSNGVDILAGANNNTIGGTQAGEGNVIAANDFNGVTIEDATTTGNRVLSNSIYSNGGLGIDLLGPGETVDSGLSTPNDPNDTDSGPNRLQNKPVLSSAKNGSGKTTIKGTLDSRHDEFYRVRFFSNPAGNEGKKCIGENVVKTNGSGDDSFTFSPSS